MSETPLVSRNPLHDHVSTIVRIGARHGAREVAVGGDAFVVAVGPCSVEGRDMLLRTASVVSQLGAGLLRGGAFKPRTSPYAFQGLGEPALELLSEARHTSGMPIVTEVIDVRQVDLVARHADVLQIGARNMYNAPLLAEVGDTGLPVLLKRSFSATLRELISAAEYIALRGNTNIIFCERGIRTFESATRNTLDVAAIPILKRETHLPVFVDPSHAAGSAELVLPLACAAMAAGADGLLVEVHPTPETALSDGEQSLNFDGFEAMMHALTYLRGGRERMEGATPLPDRRIASRDGGTGRRAWAAGEKSRRNA